MKKIISMLLAVVMVLGILPVTSFATTTDLNVIEPDSWYSILLPENASEELQNAAEELNFFLDEITGITLPVVTDDGSMTADGCYISIGDTSLFQSSGNSADTLEAEASVIKTTGDSILLYGGSDVGATYAVYELLEHWFNLKIYTPDCYTYTAKETVAFEELNLTSTPAVDHRTVAQYLTWYSSWTNLRRMRVSNAGEYMNILGHSIGELLPPATYYEAHPEWYSNYTSGQVDNWQVCLSNADMRAQLIANVKAELVEDSSKKYFAIGQNDGDGFCTCDDCLALNLQYSSNNTSYSGAWLAMVNEVANACAADYPDTIFYMLAYTNRTDLAPEKNIIAASNVGVMIAPVSAQRTDSYFGNSGTGEWDNGRASSSINGWNDICDHLMMWGYVSQFGDAMVPLNIYDSLAANAQGYVEYDFEVVFEEGQTSVLPNFDTMRTYLITKSLYDGDIDAFAEAESFINTYYGPASEAMSDYFDSFIANLRAFEAKGDNYKSFVASQFLNGDWAYSPAIITDNYSKSYVDTCAGYFDTAYTALADAYSADSAEYATYKKRIDLEYFAVIYLYLELYADQLTQEQGAQLAQDVFRIVNEQSIAAISGEKINSWRSAFGVIPEQVDYTFFENKEYEDTSRNRECAFYSFSGEVGEKYIDGIKVVSYEYQPHFKFTDEGVAFIKAYAEKNGYDMLKINAYANLTNNSFVLNNQLYVSNAWKSLEISIAELTADFDFWSQSEGTTEIYMTFEFFKAPAITTSSFSGSKFAFTDFEGTVGDVTFTGFKAYSAEYQPSFTFSEVGIAKIQAYAEEVGADTLAIYTYTSTSNDQLIVGNRGTRNDRWAISYVDIATLNTSYVFKSNSSGTTTTYLRFAFVDKPLLTYASFTTSGLTIFDHCCVVDGQEKVGFWATGTSYMPKFYFTEEAVANIKAYAEANGYNTMTIHAYANLSDNAFVLNNQLWVGKSWNSLDVEIDSLTTDFLFKSQGTTSSNIYMWFEFSYQPAITTSSFSGSKFTFTDFEGTIGEVTFTGFKAYSAEYQPSFTFSEAGVAKIQAYAEEVGADTLAIYTYTSTTSDQLLVGNRGTRNDRWAISYVDIATLDTSYTFKSNSTGTTTTYLRFAFVDKPLLTYASFTTTGITIFDHCCVVDGQEKVGFWATGTSYQPKFYFTEEAVTNIKAYAEENGYNTMTIHAYANLSDNAFVLNNELWVGKTWNSLDVYIDNLTTDFLFKSQGTTSSNIYIWFEFSYKPTFSTDSFSGSKFSFTDFTGNVGGVDFTGFKAYSTEYQPSFTFSEDGIKRIKAYAQANGFDTLAVYTYTSTSSDQLLVGNRGTRNDRWAISYVDIATLDTSYTFKSNSSGTTTTYLRFVFVDKPVINYTSFTGGLTFFDHGGIVGGDEIVGIWATSTNYQPKFYFTEDAVTNIKAYAEANGYNTMTIHAYASLNENAFVINNQLWVSTSWKSLDVSIADLTTDFLFKSQGTSLSNIYMWFEFSHVCEYSDWVVTTPATLTTTGERQKSCSCGDVITEEIPCLAGDVEAWNLTLGGDLSVNFAVNVHEDIRDTAKIMIAVAGNEKEYIVDALTPNDDGFYYVSVNVAAAQMNDTITVRIVNGEDASVTKEYTVLQYATAVLANDSYSTYHALVKEMLNYGAAAQTYFNYNANNLVNTDITGAGALDIPADAAADMAVSGKVDGISFYGASLLFRNKIAVRYYFTVTGNISDYTFTANGAEIGYDEKDGLYYIEVADINPQDLDDAIAVTVNDTLSVTYSPMNYIVRMSTKGSDNLKVLMKALYNYHVAAEGIIPDAE